MRKTIICVGISLVFFIGMVTQTSAQKIHCWDFIQNYVCDPEEDINGDGKCNSRDCQGEPAPECISCWDLNENGACDLLEEDKNKDGECTVVDCRGAAYVYDDDGQYLGILLSATSGVAEIFIPSLNLATQISTGGYPIKTVGRYYLFPGENSIQ